MMVKNTVGSTKRWRSMARCDRCDAPMCMFSFGPCSNCGLPGDRYNDDYANKNYPDTRNPEQMEQDRIDREEELTPFNVDE